MAVTMNSVNVGNNTNFKGSYSRTEQGNPYYKTSAGTTAGAVLAVPAGLNWLAANSDKRLEFSKKIQNMYKDANMLDKNTEKAFKDLDAQMAHQKKYAIPFAIIASGLTLACGMIVDHIRNNKAKEVADLTKQVGVKNAMMHGEGVAISQNGRTYYDSNIGSKYGALMGAGCGVVSSIMTQGKFKLGNVVGGAAMFALGGWLMGKLADHNTNKAAARKA